MGWINNRVRWKVEASRLWNRLLKTDKDRLVYKVLQWDMACHRPHNKANFVSNIKQILCEIKLKSHYKDMNTVDLEFARKSLMETLENNWKKISLHQK